MMHDVIAITKVMRIGVLRSDDVKRIDGLQSAEVMRIDDVLINNRSRGVSVYF